MSESVKRVRIEEQNVWCVCGETDHVRNQQYFTCPSCDSIQHWPCYQKLAEKRKAAADAPTTGTVISAASCEKKLTRKQRKELTDELVSRMLHPFVQIPTVCPGEEGFLCWACQPIPGLTAEDGTEEKTAAVAALGDRVELMLSMVAVNSGGYLRKTFVEGETVMCRTPDNVVDYLRSLILPTEEVCVDIGAGNGSFSGAMRPGSLSVEILKPRYEDGMKNRPELRWLNADALNPSFYRERLGAFDLVISNPDFEVGMQFLYLGLCLIRNACLAGGEEREHRLIYLLPSNYFEGSKFRQRLFRLWDFHIETEYRLGYLCFYANQPHGQKLTPDSLFVIRPGRGPNKYEHRVVNARMGEMF